MTHRVSHSCSVRFCLLLPSLKFHSELNKFFVLSVRAGGCDIEYVCRFDGEQGAYWHGFYWAELTWNHGISIETRRSARLDRRLCDEQCWNIYPEASIRRLHHSYFDHCSLLLKFESSVVANFGKRPFRLQATWVSHKRYSLFMKDDWGSDDGLENALKTHAQRFKVVFGNIFQRKKRINMRLQGVQWHLVIHSTSTLLKLED